MIFRFYHDQLPDDRWRYFYDRVEEAVRARRTLVRVPEIPGASGKDYKRALEFVYSDHPEFFYFDTYKTRLHRSQPTILVTLSYWNTPEQSAFMSSTLERTADEIIHSIFPGGVDKESDLAKEKHIFDWVTRNITYDHTSLDYLEQRGDFPSGDAWTAYGALVLRTAVCQGIAGGFKLLCDRVGIPSLIALGKAGERHAWNLVRIVDRFYHVDCTWDLKSSISTEIPFAKYQYFNVPDLLMLKSRKLEASFLPPCQSLRYNPFRIKGLCAFDRQELEYIVTGRLAAGETRFAVLCYDCLPSGDELPALLKQIARKVGRNFNYLTDKYGNYLGITAE